MSSQSVYKSCTEANCRKRKDLNEHGRCPEHVIVDPPTSEIHDEVANDVAADQENCSCPKCNAVVKDDDPALLCDLCKCWFHVTCTTMSNEFFNKMKDDQSNMT